MIGGHNDSVKNARVKRALPSFSCARGDESWRHSEKDRQAVHSSDLAVTLGWLLLAPTVRNYKELQVSKEMQVKVVMSHTDQQLHVAAAWYHFTNFETESAFCVPTTAICIRLKQLLRGGPAGRFGGVTRKPRKASDILDYVPNSYDLVTTHIASTNAQPFLPPKYERTLKPSNA